MRYLNFMDYAVIAACFAMLQRILFFKHMVEWQQFVYVFGIGVASSVVGTYLTRPVTRGVFENFYRTTQPFGLWKPLRDALPFDEYAAMKREHFHDIISVPFGLGWMITILLLPMQLMVREYTAFGWTFVLFIISMTGLYFFWYRRLGNLDTGIHEDNRYDTAALSAEPMVNEVLR